MEISTEFLLKSEKLRTLALTLEQNEDFKKQCDTIFRDIIYVIENGFSYKFGSKCLKIWGKNQLKSANRKNISKLVASSIIQDTANLVAYRSKDEDNLVKNVGKIISNPKTLSKEMISRFVIKNFVYECNIKLSIDQDTLYEFLRTNFSLD